jgi:hypothetical protein
VPGRFRVGAPPTYPKNTQKCPRIAIVLRIGLRDSKSSVPPPRLDQTPPGPHWINRLRSAARRRLDTLAEPYRASLFRSSPPLDYFGRHFSRFLPPCGAYPALCRLTDNPLRRPAAGPRAGSARAPRSRSAPGPGAPASKIRWTGLRRPPEVCACSGPNPPLLFSGNFPGLFCPPSAPTGRFLARWFGLMFSGVGCQSVKQKWARGVVVGCACMGRTYAHGYCVGSAGGMPARRGS